MGNCLLIQNSKGIRVMSMSFVDGETFKALPAPPPPPHVNGDDDHALPKPRAEQHRQVDPAGDMGQLHGLLPGAAKDDEAGAVVRVKLVIRKQDLRKMLGKDSRQEGVSLEDMVSLMRRDTPDDTTSCWRPAGWHPALHSIPEGGDFSY